MALYLISLLINRSVSLTISSSFKQYFSTLPLACSVYYSLLLQDNSVLLTIILSFAPSTCSHNKIQTMHVCSPDKIKNNAYAKFWWGKQSVLLDVEVANWIISICLSYKQVSLDMFLPVVGLVVIHAVPEIRGGPVSPKNFFGPSGLSLVLK